MTVIAFLVGTLAALFSARLLFVWMFEDVDSFLGEFGLRHRSDPSWQLIRSIQPAWVPALKLVVVVMALPILVALATATLVR